MFLRTGCVPRNMAINPPVSAVTPLADGSAVLAGHQIGKRRAVRLAGYGRRWATRRAQGGMQVTKRVVLVLGLVLTVRAAFAEDPLDRRLQAIARRGTDCGRIGEGGSPRATVLACVTKHFTSNRPFHARVDGFTEDSHGGLGLVLEDAGGNRGGAFFVVCFDSIGCGAEKAADPYCGTVVRQCDRPQLIPEGERLKVICKNQYTF